MSIEKEPPKVGHAIDGIEEYDNPLPGWWLMMFYFTIFWAVAYQILYPSWFGKGYLNWSQNTAYQEEIKEAKIKYPVKVISIADFIGKADHIEQGRQVFTQNCAACHGPEGKGLVGPNLTDDVWIHGGKPEEIVHTITNGVKTKGMPTWGPVLGNEKVANAASFVFSLSHDPSGNLLASAHQVVKKEEAPARLIDLKSLIGDKTHIAAGKQVFAQNCVSCHGPEAKGLVGPNLTDNTWIHGGKPEQIQNTITNGVSAKGMPTWGPIIGPEKVADVSTFIYSLSHK
jgi:cytochrome c oxidase cbb3-type subunit 3